MGLGGAILAGFSVLSGIKSLEQIISVGGSGVMALECSGTRRNLWLVGRALRRGAQRLLHD